MSGLLYDLNAQVAMYKAQRAQFEINFQQITGAIAAIEELIKKESQRIESSKDASSSNGESENGEIIDEIAQ